MNWLKQIFSLEFMARNCLRPAVARAARTGPGRGTPDSPGVWESDRRLGDRWWWRQSSFLRRRQRS